MQAIVHIRNEFKIPIYPISTGINLGFDGSAPILNNSVVLDLSQLEALADYLADPKGE